MKKVTQKQVTDFIFAQYDITLLPKYFYMQLAKIPKGNYKGQGKPIPFDDLLDMWERKMPYLTRTYQRNCEKGKRMDGIARVMYDLAILMSKYDSYLEWKTMNETNKTTEIAIARSEKIEYKNVTNAAEKIENDDMNNVLDDIWVE
jgi:hypothetical protein